MVIHVDDDRVDLTFGVAGELRDHVHADMFPRTSGYLLGLERSLRVRCWLVALALIASKDVALYVGGHLGPPVVARYQFERGMFSGVPGGRNIVTRLDDVVAQHLILWDVEFPAEIDEVLVFFPFEGSVMEMPRAGLSENVECRSYFDFALGVIVPHSLFERGVFDESCRGGNLKQLRTQNNL